MATLNTIMDNIRFGEDYTKFKCVKEGLEKRYDSEIGLFYASGRVRDIANNMTLTESEESKINRIITKLKSVENKFENGKLMSEAYRKMEATAIFEDCKALEREVGTARKVDSKKLEGFGKIVAATKFFVESFVDTDAVLSRSENPLLNKFINEETEYITQII